MAMSNEKRVNPDDAWIEQLGKPNGLDKEGKPTWNFLPDVRHCRKLTKTQAKVAALLAEGNSPYAVAEAMGISTNTIAKHKRTTHIKLNVSNRQQLVGSVVALGLIKLPTGNELEDTIEQYNSLTPRQQEALQSLANGLSIEDVGKSMGIEFHTANDHMKMIYKRFNLGRGRISEENGKPGHNLFDPMGAAILNFIAVKLEAIRIYKERYPEIIVTSESPVNGAGAVPAASVEAVPAATASDATQPPMPDETPAQWQARLKTYQLLEAAILPDQEAKESGQNSVPSNTVDAGTAAIATKRLIGGEGLAK